MQCSTIGHCVFGIQEQVQENLLQAPGVALNGWEMGSQFIVHPDLRGPELVFQQAQGIQDYPVHVNFSELGAAGA